MCTLNLCHRKPDTLQKDSVQSEHLVLRKRQKSDLISLICQLSGIYQYLGTFWAFSQHWMLRLS